VVAKKHAKAGAEQHRRTDEAREVREELYDIFDDQSFELRVEMIRFLARKAIQIEKRPLTIGEILYRIKLAVEKDEEEDETPLFKVSHNVLANTLCQDKLLAPARNHKGQMTFWYTGPRYITGRR
jgi:hypothetical protein